MLSNDVSDAANCFSKACQLLASQYGQSADELATPYLYYGKSLLELGRIENDVLGHAIQEVGILTSQNEEAVPEDAKGGIQIEEVEIDETAREELKASVEHAMRDGNLYNDDVTEDEATEDESEVDEENVEPSKVDVQVESMEDDVIETEKTETTVPEESSLQLAWEMLELSTIIYKRLGPDANVKLAEAKHALALVSMETEHYEQAIGDFKECLEYQKQIMPLDDRRIAESYYNIGLAYSLDNKFAESLEWYRKSVETLKTRITNLEHKVKVKSAEEFGEVAKSGKVESMQAELEELRDIVMLDLVAKIENVEQAQKTYSESVEDMKSIGKSAFSNQFDSGFGSSNGDVNTVKARSTKRKSEEDASALAKGRKMDIA